MSEVAIVVSLPASAADAFSSNQPAASIRPCRELPANRTASWVVSTEQLRALDPLVVHGVARAYDSLGFGPRLDPATYHRQYIGLVIEGRRLVYVNAEHPEPIAALKAHLTESLGDSARAEERIRNLLSRPMQSTEGGATSWGVMIDPRTKRLGAVAVNCTAGGQIQEPLGTRLLPPTGS